MSTKKSISIMEYLTPKNAQAETIVTDETGASQLIWVPWSAREHVGELEVTHNGEYVAADDGLFGWTKVNVLVAGGNDAQMEVEGADGTVRDRWVRAPASTVEDDAGYGSGAVIGEYEGKVFTVTLDDEGNLVWTEQESEEDDKVWVDQSVMTAINNAIKSKTGQTSDYEPEDMAQAIIGISTATLGTKTITANGTYSASRDGYDGYSRVQVNVSSGGGSDPDPIAATNLPYTDESKLVTEATLENYEDLKQDSTYHLDWWGSNETANRNFRLNGYYGYIDDENAVRLGMRDWTYNNAGSAFVTLGLSDYENGFTIYAVIRPIAPDSDSVIASTARTGIMLVGNPYSVYSIESPYATNVAAGDGYTVIAIAGGTSQASVFFMDQSHTSGTKITKSVSDYGNVFTFGRAFNAASGSDPDGMCDVFVRYFGVVCELEGDSTILQNMQNLMSLYLADEGKPVYLPYLRYHDAYLMLPYDKYDTMNNQWGEGTSAAQMVTYIASRVTLHQNAVYVNAGSSYPIAVTPRSSNIYWASSHTIYVVMRYVELPSDSDNEALNVTDGSGTLATIRAKDGKWHTGSSSYIGNDATQYAAFAIALDGDAYRTKIYVNDGTVAASLGYNNGSFNRIYLAKNANVEYKFVGFVGPVASDETVGKNLQSLRSIFGLS